MNGEVMEVTAAAGIVCCDNTELTEQQRVDFARSIAKLAADIDYPGTRHISDRLHDIAEELAGNRVAEIYGPDEGDDVFMPAMASQEG